MVHTAARGGDHLHPLHVAVFGQPRLNDLGWEHVGAFRRNGEALLHRHDQIRFAVHPFVQPDQVERRRCILRVAAGRARVHPSGDGGDLLVTQGRIVAVGPDSAIEVPGWHLPGDHAVLDRARPGPDLIVGQERHRGGGTRTVALLARALEDRQHVLRERRCLAFVLGGKSRSGAPDDQRQRQQTDGCVSSFHDALPRSSDTAGPGPRSPARRADTAMSALE